MPVPVERFVRVREAVGKFPSDVGRLIDSLELDNQGAAGSRAQAELQEHGEPDGLETVSSQASLQLEAAGDYLFGVVRLLEEPAMALAPYASGRGVLEPSAVLLWLLDSRASGRERLGRSLSLRFKGVSEQLKFFRAIQDSGQIDASLAKIARIVKAADGRGVQVDLDRFGAVRRVGPEIPSTTSLAKDFLNAEADFRLMSAVAHSQGSFVLATSFKPIGRGITEKSLSTDLASYVLAKSAMWFARASWEQLSFLGTGQSSLTTLLERLYDSVCASEDARFWRTSEQ